MNLLNADVAAKFDAIPEVDVVVNCHNYHGPLSKVPLHVAEQIAKRGNIYLKEKSSKVLSPQKPGATKQDPPVDPKEPGTADTITATK